MDAATATQLRLIGEIAAALDAEAIPWWLFGGWAMDFHAGEVTRDHSDIEIFIWKHDAERARDALTARGFNFFAGLYPDEARAFLKDGQEIGLWFVVTNDAGRVVTPGRWADWPWPAGSFDAPRQRSDDIEAPVMSLEGLLDMKLGFASHPHGAPLREKDLADIDQLKSLIAHQDR